jgi:hypothetical protein
MNLAWKAAENMATLLPRSITWSFNITDLEDDAVFNIYADAVLWDDLRTLLGLLRDPAEDGKGYMTWYNGSLALSLIQPEEQDGPESEPERDGFYH